MKTVFPTREVCHLWANGIGRDIRNSRSNVYTIHNGRTLLSYGEHFVIGAFVSNKKGGRVLLWNSDNYGPTTSRHKSHAWRALWSSHRQDLIGVPGIQASELADLPRLAAKIVKSAFELLDSSHRQRQNRPHSLNWAERQLSEAARLYRFAGQEKKAASLPHVAEDMSKETIRALLQQHNSAEYLLQARQLLKEGQGELRQRNNCSSARFEWDAARRAEHVLGSSATYYTKAGKKPAPVVVRLQKQVREWMEELKPKVETEDRLQFEYDLRRAVGSLYLQMHKARKGWPSSCHYSLGGWDQFSRRYSKHLIPQEALQLAHRHKLHVAVENLKLDLASKTTTISIRGSVRAVQELLQPGSLRHEKLLSYWQPRVAAALVEAQEREEAEALKKIEENRVAVEEWRAGTRHWVPNGLPHMMRIKDDVVQTSLGASVPVAHAQRLVRIAHRVAAAGGHEWTNNDGPMVGHFRVQRIGDDLSCDIGCHHFSASESAHAVALLRAIPQQVAEPEVSDH